MSSTAGILALMRDMASDQPQRARRGQRGGKKASHLRSISSNGAIAVLRRAAPGSLPDCVLKEFFFTVMARSSMLRTDEHLSFIYTPAASPCKALRSADRRLRLSLNRFRIDIRAFRARRTRRLGGSCMIG